MYDYSKLPEGLQGGMKRYVEHGMVVGDFLRGCLDNDLWEAVSRADDTNLKLLPEIVQWLHWEVPSACWGSRAKVAEWQGLQSMGLQTVRKMVD